jgi:hypothetical protein
LSQRSSNADWGDHRNGRTVGITDGVISGIRNGRSSRLGAAGLDGDGHIVLRRKLSRNQVVARFASLPPCLIGMEACVEAHHLSRQLQALGHDARLMAITSSNEPYQAGYFAACAILADANFNDQGAAGCESRLRLRRLRKKV